MSTHSLTNDSMGVTGSELSPGLPEMASLAQLANEFFRALPGTSESVSPHSLQVPESDLALAEVPVVQPASMNRSTPSPSPRSERTPGQGLALGVPTAYAAALPQVSTLEGNAPKPPLTLPTSPYYFLGEVSGYPASAAAGQPSADALKEDWIAPRAFGLPGAGELRNLLAPVSAALLASPQAERFTPSSTAAATPFYFLETKLQESERTPNYGATVTGLRLFDVQAVRRDFPILQERINGRPLIWLDNAATTQKPQAVIDRLNYFYAHENSNIHRAAHELAARATDAYEAARNKVARFIGAQSAEEIVFVRGATEAINLVAQSYGRQHIGVGDEIVVSVLEHHANIVPWQQLSTAVGAKIKVMPVDDSGQILLDEYQKLLNGHTKLVAITQVSNALGTITPVKEIIELAHRVGARVLVDGAQAVSHMRVNVQALDADFYVFSGHKVLGPTGIGVVYGKDDLLEAMPPWQGGGNMISDVTFEKTTYQHPPTRFEAGTGNIADAVGLGAAIDYLDRLGLENVNRYEHELLEYATQSLQAIPGLRLIGTARDKTSVLSFVLNGYRPDEVGAALSHEGIAVRSGHHCAQPILRRFGLEATVRPSLAFYNTYEEIDCLARVVKQLAYGR